MPVIYITNKKAKSNDLNALQKYFEYSDVIQTKEDLVNYFHNEENFLFKDTDGNFIISIGVFIYEDECGEVAHKNFLSDFQKSDLIKKLLSDTRGQFCLIVGINNKLHIITDKIGAIPVYLYKKDDCLEISTVLLPLLKNNKVTLNYHWIAQFLSQGNSADYLNVNWYIGTIANEISPLNSGSVYTFDTNSDPVQYYDIHEKIIGDDYENSDSIISVSTKNLIENLSAFNGQDSIHCDITGGFDTRTNLAVLINNHIKPTLGNQIPVEYNHLSNVGKFNDLTISQKISKLLNLPLFTFTETIFSPDREKFYNMAFELFYTDEEGYTNPRRLGYYSYIRDQIKRRIIVCGIYGTETFTQSPYDPEDFSQNFSTDSFLYKYYPYYNLIKDDLFTEEDYFVALRRNFEKTVKCKNFGSIKNPGTYIQYLLFYKTSFSKYHGAGNFILPIYSPFQEANHLEAMIKTPDNLKSKYLIQRSIISNLNEKLGDIETSHGFPAAKITRKNFYRFIRIFNIWETNLQYKSPFERIYYFIKNKTIKLVKSNKAATNIGFCIYTVLYKGNDYKMFELNSYQASLKQIEDQADSMLVFKIIDRKKFQNLVRKEEIFIKKILHLERLLKEMNY